MSALTVDGNLQATFVVSTGVPQVDDLIPFIVIIHVDLLVMVTIDIDTRIMIHPR